MKKESELGCRYSSLLDLPYFDAPNMLALDPMHNLFLGSGKHMIKIWIQKGLLDNSVFDKIQAFVDNMNVPCDVGRIPSKIKSGFSSFKADQFKSWTILFSIPALFDILPTEHLECWRTFVLACRILCKHTLSITDINLADTLLLQFCRKVECIYGNDAISPNMHMHCHLKEVILDYGPIQEFWLFSFERYNGILGKQPTNNKAIETQLMSRFLNDNVESTFSYPDEFKEKFQPVCESVRMSRLVGSVLDTVSTCDDFKLPSRYFRAVLSQNELKFLEEIYFKYSKVGDGSNVIVNSIYLKYSSISIRGREFNSSGKRTRAAAVSLASWDNDLFGDPPTHMPNTVYNVLSANVRPVNIHHYMKVNFTVNSSAASLIFAQVSWFFPHPDRNAFGKPVELWCSRQFEPSGIHSFVPINNIISRCAHGTKFYNDESLLVVVPLVE